jgi:hypothetical protein
MIFEEIGGLSHLSERIKFAIKDNGGYDYISEITEISVSTLKRIAAGKTEPKFKDVVNIAEATRTPLMYLTYGNGKILEGKFEMLISDIIRESRKKDIDLTGFKMAMGMIFGSLETMNLSEKDKDRLAYSKMMIMEEFTAPIIGRDE